MSENYNFKSEAIGELLAGVSDGLTNQIDIFLLNSDLTNEQKTILMELFNQSYLEGGSNVQPRWIKDASEASKKEADEWKNAFDKLLKDGDGTVS